MSEAIDTAIQSNMTDVSDLYADATTGSVATDDDVLLHTGSSWAVVQSSLLGSVGTDPTFTTITGTATTAAQPNITSIASSANITSDLVQIEGNLTVSGEFAVDATQVEVTDNYIYVNTAYTSTTATRCGIIANQATAGSAYAIQGAFVPAVNGVSNANVDCADGGFQEFDYVQIYGTTSNDGIYEVHSYSGGNLQLKGGLDALTYDIVLDDFTSESAAGNVQKIILSALVTATDGEFQQYVGATSSGRMRPIQNYWEMTAYWDPNDGTTGWSSSAGSITVQDESYVLVTLTTIGDTATYTVNLGTPGWYRAHISPFTSNDSGDFNITTNGTTAASDMSFWISGGTRRPTVVTSPASETDASGNAIIVFEVTGKNASSSNYYLNVFQIFIEKLINA